ncbi:hypothetical protein NL676_023991 [Syzygium grande]|nr:hypothetical protein NL676_023991 [Syzygium grande]
MVVPLGSVSRSVDCVALVVTCSAVFESDAELFPLRQSKGRGGRWPLPPLGVLKYLVKQRSGQPFLRQANSRSMKGPMDASTPQVPPHIIKPVSDEKNMPIRIAFVPTNPNPYLTAT